MHAHAIELIDASEFSCEHSERCGGCAFMGTPVAVQLTRKRAQVRSALDAYPALHAVDVGEVAPAETMLGYRTRAKLVAAADGALGLFARGGHDVVDIPGCRVLHPLLLQVAAEVRALLQSQPGVLSGVDLRLVTGESEPGVLLTVNGDARGRPQLQAFAESLSHVKGVLGIALRAHAQGAIQQLEGIPEPVSGVAMARDALRAGGLYHYASHGSFVQVHREQAAALSARLIARLTAALSGGLRGRRILELYAGSGGLALALCAEGAHVLCVERYAPALEHALRAQREQNLQGLAAKSGEAEYVLDQLAAQGARFDALVVNPPRRGLSAGVRARIAELAPEAVIYVSCEPSTLARDLSDLAQRGLAADGVEPFDMMPLAADVESLVLLLPAAPTRIPVLYEDAQLLVVDKPPYLPTIPEGEHASSLLARLRDEHGLPELSAVHRLDAGTSGVCIFAKTRADVSELAARLADGQKQYLALVRGNLRLKGTVRAPLRDSGKTRQATTRYARAERVGGHALVRVRPEQGRTHQVRKHMAALGHPVLGDARYGDAASNRFFEHKHGLQRPFCTPGVSGGPPPPASRRSRSRRTWQPISRSCSRACAGRKPRVDRERQRSTLPARRSALHDAATCSLHVKMETSMATLDVLVLEGDGIGPEVTAEALRVLGRVAELASITLNVEQGVFGGASIDKHGEPITEAVLARSLQAHATLLGACGGPKWDNLPTDKRPEKGLLRLREHMQVYANLRPAKLFAALADASPLKAERAAGFDFVVVRELVGGLYFGKPRYVQGEPGKRVGLNTMTYTEAEIVRIGRVAFETARLRKKKLCSVDKANVLEVMGLWRDVMIQLGKQHYPDVALSHMYVDNAAMQLILRPTEFDVLVMENMFGDILSDLSAAATGSIGLLPSAAIGDKLALYEPIHGSAPDIAGQNKANPLAAIMTTAMLLEHTAKRPELALAINRAVEDVLNAGSRTGDIAKPGETVIGTRQMGEAVLKAVERRLS